MRVGMTHQKEAVDCGHWPLYRYHPERAHKGENPFKLDSKQPKLPIAKYMGSEARYRMLELSDPKAAERFRKQAQHDVEARFQHLSQLAKLDYSADKEEV
jgi:pyruvate-ferredoxin/flavodoxin oxidoreductase